VLLTIPRQGFQPWKLDRHRGGDRELYRMETSRYRFHVWGWNVAWMVLARYSWWGQEKGTTLQVGLIIVIACPHSQAQRNAARDSVVLLVLQLIRVRMGLHRWPSVLRDPNPSGIPQPALTRFWLNQKKWLPFNSAAFEEHCLE